MMILFVFLSLAWAEELFLRVAVGDTEQNKLSDPTLVVNNTSIPLLDDGTISGDVASDGIWVASVFVASQSQVELQVQESGVGVGTISIQLPQAKTHTIQLKTTATDIIVDVNAPKMPWEGGGRLSLSAEALTGVPSSGDGLVRLRILLNDQPMKGLRKPTVRVAEQTVRFLDDGTDPSDTSLDHIWVGWIDVPRQEKVQLIFEDEYLGLGFVDISLPATPAASVMVYRLPSGLSRFAAQLRAVDKAVVQATSLLGAAPRAEGGAPMVSLNVMIDMRGVDNISRPVVQYKEEEMFLFDDGSVQGDDAGDAIYVGTVHVAQENTAELVVLNGAEELGKATVFLPESGRALVKLQVNNGLNGWVEQGKSDLPMVAFSLPVSETRPIGTQDTEQEIDFIFSGSIPKSTTIRISGSGTVLGLFSISQERPHISARIPILTRLRVAVVEDGVEKDVFWLIPSKGEQSFVGIRYDKSRISLEERIEFEGVEHIQKAPLVVQAVPKSDDAFTGKTLLSIRLTDPLQELVKPEVVGLVSLERESSGSFQGSFLLEHEPFVVLELQDGAQSLSSMVVFLPETANASLGLVNSRVGIQASDTSSGVSEEPLIFEAAKEGTEGLTDKISVQLLVDDRVLQRLRSPIIRLAEEGREEIELRDDGEEQDGEALDQVYTASFVVERAEYLQLAVEDKGKPFGEMTVFLPSSSEAKIRLRTIDAKNGLKLLTEAQALSEVDAPSMGTSAQEGGEGEKKLIHILWVSIVLFALFFAYVRSVVFQTWRSDIQPLLQRLEKMLEERKK